MAIEITYMDDTVERFTDVEDGGKLKPICFAAEGSWLVLIYPTSKRVLLPAHRIKRIETTGSLHREW